jgi:hypothetical protein
MTDARSCLYRPNNASRSRGTNLYDGSRPSNVRSWRHFSDVTGRADDVLFLGQADKLIEQITSEMMPGVLIVIANQAGRTLEPVPLPTPLKNLRHDQIGAVIRAD